jgi:hypothetical protein
MSWLSVYIYLFCAPIGWYFVVLGLGLSSLSFLSETHTCIIFCLFWVQVFPYPKHSLSMFAWQVIYALIISLCICVQLMYAVVVFMCMCVPWHTSFVCRFVFYKRHFTLWVVKSPLFMKKRSLWANLWCRFVSVCEYIWVVTLSNNPSVAWLVHLAVIQLYYQHLFYMACEYLWIDMSNKVVQ